MIPPVRCRVIAARGVADLRVHHRVHLHAHVHGLTDFDLVCTNALHRHVTSIYVGKNQIMFCVVEDADVTHLATGISVERRVVENGFAFVTRVESLYANPVLNQRQDFAAFGFRLAIAFKRCLAQVAIDGRSTRLGAAFP